ncbi:(2Fe-2S)-binding protein, partial [Streptomyces sp. H27-D2]|uniref:(2Fe-2S)-binding protein n=1 Tax=Streptomyces sp. H27-D2 TaxID=3046304 RepID=UPI002DB98206
AGALKMLRAGCRSADGTAAAERASALTRTLFDDPLLRDTGNWRAAGERDFVRRSCCLYYRVPGGGMCGDCVLLPTRTSHPAPGA